MQETDYRVVVTHKPWEKLRKTGAKWRFLACGEKLTLWLKKEEGGLPKLSSCPRDKRCISCWGTKLLESKLFGADFDECGLSDSAGHNYSTLTYLLRTAESQQSIQEIGANAHETRESLQQFSFISLAENWAVQAKLIYNYQILSGSHNNSFVAPPCEWYTDLCCSPKLPKKSIKPPILAFRVI